MRRRSVFVGDITDAPAEALCTSTNPRLSLVMGTGAAVRERGGIAVLRECEAVIANSGRRALPAGSVYATTAGALPHKMVIHCVASDAAHRSSPEIIAACVRGALACAQAAGCRSIAMPVFGTGHAHVRFDRALEAMLGAMQTELDVVIVVNDPERAEYVGRVLNPSAAA